MLTKVQVESAQGALLDFSLSDPTNGFIVAGMDGLDPVKATLVSSSFAGLDGEQYQSARREARNLKLSLELVPDWVLQSVRSLRNQLYGFFMPKSSVKLRFFSDDGPTLEISGRVETFETNMFVADPTIDISLMCFDPNFVDPTPVVFSSFSTYRTVDAFNKAIYKGTIETGVQFDITVNRAIDGISIAHQAPDGTIRNMDIIAPMGSGGVVTIRTIRGSKSIRLVNPTAGVDKSILYAVSPQSAWLELQPGENGHRVTVAGNGLPYTLTYTTKYGGF